MMTAPAPHAHSKSGVSRASAPVVLQPVISQAVVSDTIAGRTRSVSTPTALVHETARANCSHRSPQWLHSSSTSSAAPLACIVLTYGLMAARKLIYPKMSNAHFLGRYLVERIRFGAPRVGEWFAVAEGIETALSVGLACAMPAWAALSAGGIKNLILPPEAAHIVICADHDASGTGERAAHDAAARWVAEGRRVRVATPPQSGTDFNDVLTGHTAAKINGARHVA